MSFKWVFMWGHRNFLFMWPIGYYMIEPCHAAPLSEDETEWTERASLVFWECTVSVLSTHAQTIMDAHMQWLDINGHSTHHIYALEGQEEIKTPWESTALCPICQWRPRELQHRRQHMKWWSTWPPESIFSIIVAPDELDLSSSVINGLTQNARPYQRPQTKNRDPGSKKKTHDFIQKQNYTERSWQHRRKSIKSYRSNPTWRDRQHRR